MESTQVGLWFLYYYIVLSNKAAKRASKAEIGILFPRSSFERSLVVFPFPFNSSLMGHMKRLDIKFRILIIGRANSGKTSILEKVCDTSESPKIYRRARERGKRCQHFRFHHPFRLKSTPQQSYSAPQSHIVGLWLSVRILFVARQA